MIINDLIIEVTRKCNVFCEHCLRGKSQKIDISESVIDNLLNGVESIGCVTFTGGEPSLAVNKIKYFTKKIRELGITVNSFYVVTNGKIASRKLVDVLIDLYMYCEDYYDDFYGGICISGDQFHKEKIKSVEKARKLYGCLKFFMEEERQKDIDYNYIINEGNAKKNHIGAKEAIRYEIDFEQMGDGKIEYVESQIYINALGDVCTSCDLSYDSQEKEKIGSVNEKTIEKILLEREHHETIK